MRKEADSMYELVFVNDGSKDHTWEKILELKEEKSTYQRSLLFQKFWKEGAVLQDLTGRRRLYCSNGLRSSASARNTYKDVSFMEDGYQVIEGVKASRGRKVSFTRCFAKTFYSIISDATGIIMSRASDFKLMDRQAAEEFLKLPERNVFFRALSSWWESRQHT